MKIDIVPIILITILILLGLTAIIIGIILPLFFVNKTETIQIPQECPTLLPCEPKTITKEIPIEKIITKEVIKEVPVEKLVYTDKVIYKESPDCQLDLVKCNDHRREVFELFYETRELLDSCKLNIVDYRASYVELLEQYKIMLDIVGNPNTEYLRTNRLSDWVNQFTKFSSTSDAFLGKMSQL